MDNTDNTDNNENLEIVADLTPEQVEKIKAAANNRAVADEEYEDVAEESDEVGPNDIGEAANKDEAKDAEQIKPTRNVALSKNATIDVYRDDEVVNTLKPDRNIIECLLVLKTLDPDTVVSIYATEDEKLSDPAPEGEESPKYPLFGITKKTVKEAIETFASQGIPDQACVMEFQRLCEFMSFRSTLMALNAVLVFKGGRAGGFSYFSSCSEVPDSDAIALYTAAREQNKQYKEKLKEIRPQIKFDDDTNIITHL